MHTDIPIPSGPMSAGQERALYLEGIRLFNSREFFASHELWEDVWRMSTGTKREFYQGLIQCAVALEHFRRGNARGVVSLHKTYRLHFSRVPQAYMGLDIRSFLEEMELTLKPVLERSPVPDRGVVLLNQREVPRISLMSDPFGTSISPVSH